MKRGEIIKKNSNRKNIIVLMKGGELESTIGTIC